VLVKTCCRFSTKRLDKDPGIPWIYAVCNVQQGNYPGQFDYLPVLRSTFYDLRCLLLVARCLLLVRLIVCSLYVAHSDFFLCQFQRLPVSVAVLLVTTRTNPGAGLGGGNDDASLFLQNAG
jgi:hypothetical protein